MRETSSQVLPEPAQASTTTLRRGSSVCSSEAASAFIAPIALATNALRLAVLTHAVYTLCGQRCVRRYRT